MPLMETVRRAGLVALGVALFVAGARGTSTAGAATASQSASAGELLAQAEHAESTTTHRALLPDLVLARRDSLSLPMSTGGPLVFDMTNVGSARSGATSLTVSWDGQPAKSFYVPPLIPGARTGLRMVVPEGVQTLTAEVNPDRSFAEARHDNNRIVETVGEGPVAAPTVTTTGAPTTAPPAAAPPPTTAPPRTTRRTPASPLPSPEAAIVKPETAPKPRGAPFRLPPEVFMILGAIGVLAGVVAAVIALAHRAPRMAKPRIVAIPEFHARPVTSHSAVRTPAVTPRDPHLRSHEPPTESDAAIPRPTVWDVFEAGDQATVAQRELLDETACIKALRAKVGTVGDTYWDHAYKALLDTMRDSMSIPLEQILISAWTRWGALQPLLADSRTRQQEDIVVPTGMSTVAATHHVHVTAQLGGALVRPGMGLVIEVASAFDACTFVIHQGRIIEVETDGPKVEAVVRCDSAPVLRRELTRFELPRIVVVEPQLESRSPDRGAPVV